MPGIIVKQFWMTKIWGSKAKAAVVALAKHIGKIFRHRRLEIHRVLILKGIGVGL